MIPRQFRPRRYRRFIGGEPASRFFAAWRSVPPPIEGAAAMRNPARSLALVTRAPAASSRRRPANWLAGHDVVPVACRLAPMEVLAEALAAADATATVIIGLINRVIALAARCPRAA
jgi:hypothetical protein